MVTIRTLQHSDATDVVERIARQLNDDAVLSPLVNAHVDRSALHDTILLATHATWVGVQDDAVVGHLYAAVLNDSSQPRAAWTGPDGASFDSEEILAQLLDQASAAWRHARATRHYAWALNDARRLDPWCAMGYAPLSVRGVMRLEQRETRTLPGDLRLRKARIEDMDRILELDHVIDLAQGEPVVVSHKDREATRHEMLSLLEDPEVKHYVVEGDQRVLAQAIAFPLPPRRGSFDNTLHLSEVAVDPEFQQHGVAGAMIDTVLDEAKREGFQYVEAQWRVTNQQASSFWPRYGLTPTYVCLGRDVDLGE